MKDVIIAKDLSCFYGPVLGLNRVDFSIPKGITGLVGPNGAGKSTLIKLLTGQLKPSVGRLSVLEEDPLNNVKLLGKIGYCPEHEHMHSNVSPIVLLRSLSSLSGVSWAQSKKLSERALEDVQLAPTNWNKRIGTFSKGMKQRVKLAQAIVHDPELLILDEPMNGLDPMGRNDISEILKKLRNRGIHILISSHILNELESLCEHFLMLKWGRVVASGSCAEISIAVKQRSDQIRIKTDKPKALVEHLSRLKLLKGYLIQGNELILWLSDANLFYEKWPEYLNVTDVCIFEIVDDYSSLENIFNRVFI